VLRCSLHYNLHFGCLRSLHLRPYCRRYHICIPVTRPVHLRVLVVCLRSLTSGCWALRTLFGASSFVQHFAVPSTTTLHLHTCLTFTVHLICLHILLLLTVRDFRFDARYHTRHDLPSFTIVTATDFCVTFSLFYLYARYRYLFISAVF